MPSGGRRRPSQGLASFNMGYADKTGNIFYLYNAKLPMRAEGYDWDLYLPGDTSETLWTDYLPFDDLPQVLNPPSGFVQNANSTPFQTTIGEGNPDPARYSETFGIDMGMSNRALRMRELLGRTRPSPGTRCWPTSSTWPIPSTRMWPIMFDNSWTPPARRPDRARWADASCFLGSVNFS